MNKSKKRISDSGREGGTRTHDDYLGVNEARSPLRKLLYSTTLIICTRFGGYKDHLLLYVP